MSRILSHSSLGARRLGPPSSSSFDRCVSTRASQRDSSEGRTYKEEYVTLTGKIRVREVKARPSQSQDPEKELKRELRSLRNKEKKYPLAISRGDFTFGRPPFHVERQCTLADLVEAGVIGHPVDAASCGKEKVHLLIDLVPTGSGGLFGKGSVKSRLRVVCDRCCNSFDYPVDAPVSLWINLEARSETETSDPEELPFPGWAKWADATPLVSSIMLSALPSKLWCGQPGCGDGVQLGSMISTRSDFVGWESGPRKEEGVKVSAFAALAGLKGKIPGLKGKIQAAPEPAAARGADAVASTRDSAVAGGEAGAKKVPRPRQKKGGAEAAVAAAVASAAPAELPAGVSAAAAAPSTLGKGSEEGVRAPGEGKGRKAAGGPRLARARQPSAESDADADAGGAD